jgi:hypothetical protein
MATGATVVEDPASVRLPRIESQFGIAFAAFCGASGQRN